MQSLTAYSNLSLVTLLPLVVGCAGPITMNKIQFVELGMPSNNLSSMVGAFIADGHLRFRKTKRGPRYEIIFREEYKSNIMALAKWINYTFDIGIKPKKEKNHYSLYISNKIIFRYFTEIFGFTPGRKTETVAIPKIIRNGNHKM